MSGVAESTLAERQDRVIYEMARFPKWLDKYEYLVSVGRRLESPRGIQAQEHLVPGCQSRVWLRAEMDDGRMRLFADSDALITKGIIALLVRVLDGHPPAQVRDADLYFLEETGLSTHLSPSRANGLWAMVKRIREFAGERA